DSKFPFLGEFFDKGRPETRGDVPINRANLVAGLIFADVLKVHSASFEDAVVVTGKSGLDQPACFNFERADFLKNLRGCLRRRFHRSLYGTGSPAKIRSIIVSLVT